MSQYYYLLSLPLAGLVLVAWRLLLPKPYLGIPYNEESAKRVTGDIPNIIAGVKATDEFAIALFMATTRKLGVPIAQALFPGFRNPLIVLDDAREAEDILFRRGREFDKATMNIDLLAPLFPRGSVGLLTTPELKAQKRLWADVMSAEFLRNVAAPNVHRAITDLLDLWQLKTSEVYPDQPFVISSDFRNATLDVIWRAIVGQDAGTLRYEITKLQYQIEGKGDDEVAKLPRPRGSFLGAQVAYVAEVLTRNAQSASPKLAGKLETLTPRFRKFRSTVGREIGQAIKDSVARFERLELECLEDDDLDTCMMDMVLRRRIAAARKANKPLIDPSKDPNLLDEMLVMLIGGHDSTAAMLTWFVRYMGENPLVQSELRAVLRAAFPGPELPSAQQILETTVPYLDATCEETFRFSNVVPCSLRQTVVDTVILGCPVPKGAQVIMSSDLCRDPLPIDESKRTPGCKAAIAKHGDGFNGMAGRDLGIFEPRRWIVTDEATGEEKFDQHALPSLAFGGGYRGCFGRKLATMNFRIVVVLLILKMEFLDLPEEFKPVKINEGIFRTPDKAYAKVRML